MTRSKLRRSIATQRSVYEVTVVVVVASTAEETFSHIVISCRVYGLLSVILSIVQLSYEWIEEVILRTLERLILNLILLVTEKYGEVVNLIECVAVVSQILLVNSQIALVQNVGSTIYTFGGWSLTEGGAAAALAPIAAGMEYPIVPIPPEVRNLPSLTLW